MRGGCSQNQSVRLPCDNTVLMPLGRMTGPVLMPGPTRWHRSSTDMDDFSCTSGDITIALSPSITTLFTPFSPAWRTNMRFSPTSSILLPSTGLPLMIDWDSESMSSRSENLWRTCSTVIPATGRSSAYGPEETLQFLSVGIPGTESKMLPLFPPLTFVFSVFRFSFIYLSRSEERRVG